MKLLNILLIVVGFLFIISVWYFVSIGLPSSGELFQPVHALFSGLAFYAILLTLILHGSQLKKQGRHLEKTADAQLLSAELNSLSGRLNGNVALLNYYVEAAKDSANHLNVSTKAARAEIELLKNEIKDTIISINKKVYDHHHNS